MEYLNQKVTYVEFGTEHKKQKSDAIYIEFFHHELFDSVGSLI